MTVANAGSLERHIKIASGISSPNTTYSMAPEAKLNDTDSISGPMVP